MLELKVIRLIQALLSKELSTIEKYLSSPHISSNSECVQLFVQICKFHPDMDSPKLTKERLFAKIYGKRPYNDGKMRKLMTQLTQLIEQYLMETELKNSEELRTKLLASALSERNNYKLFLDVVESRLKVLDNGIDRGREYFRESHELSDMLFYHPGSVKLVKKGEYRQRANDDLERYFTLLMLQNEADKVVVTRIVTGDADKSGYMDTVMQIATTPRFVEYNAIQLFHHLVVLLRNKTQEDLGKLRKSAFDTFPKLSRFEQDYATNLLRNYAIPFSNKGSMEHARFVFDLYKLELERGLYASSMSVSAFINIVTLALAVDEIEWTKYFIEKFFGYLPQYEQDNTLNYCWGIWYYRKGVNENNIEALYEAIKSLSLIPTKAGVDYELRVRSSLLRVQFELFERGKETLDELLNQVRNFERHLRGNSLYAAPIRNSYISFLRYFKLLARLHDNLNITKTNDKSLLRKLTQVEDSVYFRTWILEKTNRLTEKS